jgi:hypothetical protein
VNECCLTPTQQLLGYIVDHWFEHRSGQTKDYNVIFVVASPPGTQSGQYVRVERFIYQFCQNRSVLEPMIYRTRGEHTNHYTTDAVLNIQILMCYIFLLSKGKDYLCLFVDYNVIFVVASPPGTQSGQYVRVERFIYQFCQNGATCLSADCCFSEL